MKKITIFQHIHCEGPGYLTELFDEHKLAYRIINIEQGDTIPHNVNEISALVFMGGPMSVNDDLPWIHAELALIQYAHQHNIPMLGHCLGGQLLSKALGAKVAPMGYREIGWHPVNPVNSAVSNEWLQDLDLSCEIFHWHGEQFEIPTAAQHLFGSTACQHQAWVLNNILALQCHIEVTPTIVHTWLQHFAEQLTPNQTYVQTPEDIAKDLDQRINKLQSFSKPFYQRWLKISGLIS
ncbi:MAG: type 1 glutamine amidotransferase [Gammaproteobacteria bacterium]|nr:type 1 glutamine amidotransferase [Gammaproteobacteria bacterium]